MELCMELRMVVKTVLSHIFCILWIATVILIMTLLIYGAFVR
jgi:hypothetical protein